jgi:hypothetical protein
MDMFGRRNVHINNTHVNKSAVFGDQSGSSRIERMRWNAIQQVKKSHPGGYPQKNTKETNSVHSALTRVRAGGSVVPAKVTNRTTGKYYP